MRIRLIISTVFIIFVCGNAIISADDITEEKQKPIAGDSTSAVIELITTSPDTSVSSKQTNLSDKIIAYYFHGTRRCVTCKKLEAYSKEAVETGFKDELEKGILEFRAVNFDEEENRHYIKDYELYTKSLVICDFDGGKQARWKNLQKIWELVRDKDAFFDYVQSEVKSYLEEN